MITPCVGDRISSGSALPPLMLIVFFVIACAVLAPICRGESEGPPSDDECVTVRTARYRPLTGRGNQVVTVSDGEYCSLEQRVTLYINQLNTASITQHLLQARRALRGFGAPALAQLHAALADERRPLVRAQVAHVLGDIGDASSVPVLEQAAVDGPPEVVRSAVGALARMHCPAAGEALVRLRGAGIEPAPVQRSRDTRASTAGHH